ncbi:UDP-glucose-4-epimerase [Dissophora globulifera]|uniref:UDP-glucose 4-epimerase n=1 Tax=Dissophora globulifera TaxID=979702 RepID=A0A9P6UNW1_9FUNG|nr:UDP-glucose-4-epimerase [Dissophora globulifera]
MSPKNTILVTGGCGYVGSHTVLSLLQSGYKVVVLDNLSNTSSNAKETVIPEALKRIQQLLSTEEAIPFYAVDIIDKDALVKIFEAHRDIAAVIHCAGLKSVGESGRRPLDYYNINIAGTIKLLQVMDDFDVRRLVFSSSATVYGDPPKIPIPEDSPIVASMSTYGRTKVFLEHIIRDLCIASEVKQKDYEKEQNAKGAKVEKDYRWNAIMLRYFNPAGAHPSGIMGEDPQGIPSNLMPYLAQVAVGNLEKLTVFGQDYPTKDGTCIRDYLHVVDCADGHVAALEKIGRDESTGEYGCKAYNLGAGMGCSVLDMVRAFSKAVGRDLPYVVSARRLGDVPNLTADPTLANTELNWRAVKTLDEMCEDLWRWQRNNPDGYRTRQ